MAGTMEFREFKIGFYTPAGTIKYDARLPEAFKKIQERFRLDKVFDWFVPRIRPFDGSATTWFDIAKSEANKILQAALKDSQQPSTKCGKPTIRDPYDPPDQDELAAVMRRLGDLVPTFTREDAKRGTRRTFDRDAFRKALGSAIGGMLKKRGELDIFNRDGDPRIHCEFISGKWVDTVEFLLLEGPNNEPWYVINAEDGVIFTASITYSCPDGFESRSKVRKRTNGRSS